METPPRIPRIGLVLSAGGLRGAAHLGVIRRLVEHRVPIEVIVGTSVGAIIGAYYASVGLTVDQMLQDARRFRGRHLVAHSLATRAIPPFPWLFRPWSGIIPSRLRQLRAARFDRLHHGVKGLGVVCHDLRQQRPCYISSARDGGVDLYDAVATSAAIPSLFRPQTLAYDGNVCDLTDGGVSDPVPVDFAAHPGLDATHLVVSDCRQRVGSMRSPERSVYLRPQLEGTTTLRAPRATLLEAVAAGEATVTDEVLGQIRGWATA